MIPETSVAQLFVITQNILPQLHDTRLVLELEVSHDETAIERNDLAQTGVLTGCLVQTSTRLDDLAVGA